MIRRDMVDQVNRIWDQLAAAGSPELRGAIESERARFHGLHDFEGRTFEEWGRMLGWGAPRQPVLYCSKPQRDENGFSITANRVPDHTVSLWWKPSLAARDWIRATNAAIRSAEHTLFITDPTPVTGTRFYQVQATTNTAATP